MGIFELFDLKTPQIMGILNLTPDSFYDGSSYKSHKEVLDKVGLMLQDGASIIDIGAYSSRPNAVHISQEEEEPTRPEITKSTPTLQTPKNIPFEIPIQEK